MLSNNTMSQSAPITVDLSKFRGRGEQARSIFADKVTGFLKEIRLREGEYEVYRDGKPVLNPDGTQMTRPNSAIAEWVSDSGERIFTNWPCRYGEHHEILLWDAFDESINLSVDHLHFEKETTNTGRVFYSLTKVEVKAQPQTQPRAQAFLNPTAAMAPWDYEG